MAPPGGIVAFAILVVVFGIQARQRSGLWMDERLLAQDSAAHYPDGIFAHRLAAVRAIEEQDFERALLEIRAFADRGGNFTEPYFYMHPTIRPLLAYPPFEAFRRELAQREIDFFVAQGDTTPPSSSRLPCGEPIWVKSTKRSRCSKNRFVKRRRSIQEPSTR